MICDDLQSELSWSHYKTWKIKWSKLYSLISSYERNKLT
ncbi:hypothetical protein F383_35682 [Gossypium arboreum]|uniref:Uncharacterized protein n=1 Tax=Gossypium arboreum TaxID=29729 RepID=A0A0B0Q0B5_GOSAR|nr:hypothetical protein F383_35682 [Gossypium arboreum]